MQFIEAMVSTLIGNFEIYCRNKVARSPIGAFGDDDVFNVYDGREFVRE